MIQHASSKSSLVNSSILAVTIKLIDPCVSEANYSTLYCRKLYYVEMKNMQKLRLRKKSKISKQADEWHMRFKKMSIWEL